MAHIKIKYRTAHCKVGYSKYSNCSYPDNDFISNCIIMHYDKYNWDDQYGYCKEYKSKSNIMNDYCVHACETSHIKERDYKSFQYDEGKGIAFGAQYIEDNAIDYLEIDGNVLIDRTKEGE